MTNDEFRNSEFNIRYFAGTYLFDCRQNAGKRHIPAFARPMLLSWPFSTAMELMAA